MEYIYQHLILSGVLTLLLWTPYILSRVFVWGLPTFLFNYPEGFPAEEPTPPLWAQRAKRAHLNMVETMPAFIAVLIGSASLATEPQLDVICHLSRIFLVARAVYAIVYTLGIPFLRTPVYLVSWAAILVMAATVLL